MYVFYKEVKRHIFCNQVWLKQSLPICTHSVLGHLLEGALFHIPSFFLLSLCFRGGRTPLLCQGLRWRSRPALFLMLVSPRSRWAFLTWSLIVLDASVFFIESTELQKNSLISCNLQTAAAKDLVTIQLPLAVKRVNP